MDQNTEKESDVLKRMLLEEEEEKRVSELSDRLRKTAERDIALHIDNTSPPVNDHQTQAKQPKPTDVSSSTTQTEIEEKQLQTPLHNDVTNRNQVLDFTSDFMTRQDKAPRVVGNRSPLKESESQHKRSKTVHVVMHGKPTVQKKSPRPATTSPANNSKRTPDSSIKTTKTSKSTSKRSNNKYSTSATYARSRNTSQDISRSDQSMIVNNSRSSADELLHEFSQQRELIHKAEDKLQHIENILGSKQLSPQSSRPSSLVTNSPSSQSSYRSQLSIPSISTSTPSTATSSPSPSTNTTKSITSSPVSTSSEDSTISKTLKEVSQLTSLLQKKRQDIFIQRKFQEFLTKKQHEQLSQSGIRSQDTTTTIDSPKTENITKDVTLESWIFKQNSNNGSPEKDSDRKQQTNMQQYGPISKVDYTTVFIEPEKSPSSDRRSSTVSVSSTVITDSSILSNSFENQHKHQKSQPVIERKQESPVKKKSPLENYLGDIDQSFDSSVSYTTISSFEDIITKSEQNPAILMPDYLRDLNSSLLSISSSEANTSPRDSVKSKENSLTFDFADSILSTSSESNDDDDESEHNPLFENSDSTNTSDSEISPRFDIPSAVVLNSDHQLGYLAGVFSTPSTTGSNITPPETKSSISTTTSGDPTRFSIPSVTTSRSSTRFVIGFGEIDADDQSILFDTSSSSSNTSNNKKEEPSKNLDRVSDSSLLDNTSISSKIWSVFEYSDSSDSEGEQ
jgi:hypothetical protein